MLISLLFFASSVKGDIVLQVTGPVDYSAYSSNPNQFGNDQFAVASWNQAVEYDGVNISFPGNGLLTNGLPSTVTGTAYLTTMMGTGTTVADQIAVTQFTAPDAPHSTISLFSGLDLAPDTYYLMIFAVPGVQIAWDATNSPISLFGTGVTLNFPVADGENLLGTYAQYPPETQYVFGLQDNLLINVTSAPEPCTLTLLFLSSAMGLVIRRPAR
jgi:hypothetical protein